jgi:hypothetical protein
VGCNRYLVTSRYFQACQRGHRDRASEMECLEGWLPMSRVAELQNLRARRMGVRVVARYELQSQQQVDDLLPALLQMPSWLNGYHYEWHDH